MIDCENEILDKVAKKLEQECPEATLASEYIRTPTSFPFVSLYEVNNLTYEATIDSGSVENHSKIAYQLDVYSNKKTQKKTECKKITNIIDELMIYLGFKRVMLSVVPNMDNASIYRITARYTAVVSKDKTIYGR